MVQHDEGFASSLWNPVEAAIEADTFRRVVVLNQIDPGQAVRKYVVDADSSETQIEFPLRKLNPVVAIAPEESPLAGRRPEHLRFDILDLAIVEIAL